MNRYQKTGPVTQVVDRSEKGKINSSAYSNPEAASEAINDVLDRVEFPRIDLGWETDTDTKIEHLTVTITSEYT